MSPRNSPALRAALAALLLAALAACVERRPVRLPFSAGDVSFDQPFYNWGAHPAEIERRLSEEPFEIEKIEEAGAGVTGAGKARLVFADGETVEVKWKAFPEKLDHWNNSPRKEIAAYEIQKWFLEPEQYVVPTTVARCIDIEQARAWKPDAEPTIDGSRCVLVALAVWLQHVTAPDQLYDEARFRSDPAYALHVANLNVLTRLIDHRDGRKGNFLLSDGGPPRAYAADNGISFDPWLWNYFVDNWNDLRVPALPKPTIERLRRVSQRDYRALAVLVEMARGDDGIYRRVAPPSSAIEPDRGSRKQGRVLQLGLTDNEIDDVRERLEDVLQAVARGEVTEF
jgi:hypothetical protein